MEYFLFAFIFAVLSPNVRAECKSSTVGRVFVFGILDMIDNCCHNSGNIIAVYVTNISPTSATIRLQMPFFNNDTSFNIPHGEMKMIHIHASIQQDGTFVGSRGIRISSNEDISVLVTNAFNSLDSIDSYNVLPTSEIGNRYIISSVAGDERMSSRGSAILVAGVHDNTNVKLINGTNVLYSTNVNYLEVFQYVCGYQCDLTGLHVVSDKYVYVLAGATAIKRDYIASEMFPTSAWSNQYIVLPSMSNNEFYIRTQLQNMSLNSVISTQKDHDSKSIVATSKYPFSVALYGESIPFMTAVPGIDQYINNYTFTVAHVYYGSKSYLAITVPDIDISGLVLDGHSIYTYNATEPMKRLKVPVPFDNYTILILKASEGFHNLFHTSASVRFGVFVYGYGSDLSYGYYAGFNLKGDCSTPTSPSDTTTITLPQTTAKYLPASYATTSSTLSEGRMCYSCGDLSHVDLCDTLKQCSDHEVCFVEKYVDGGQTKYKTGCLEQNTCEIKRNDSRYSDALCFECCHGNFCNNKGCGENGIPDRDIRGPICFDCQHVASPEECVKISPCDSHQVCRFEEYKWFDHSHFKLGCGHGLCDPVNRMGSHLFRRSTPVCHSCCTEDYCNRNCTTSSQGQTGSVIVG